jgi:hypothetical protein
VVAQADRAADAAVGVDGLPEQPQRASIGLGAGLPGPLEGRVRLGHEAADGDRAADVLAAAGLAAGADHLDRELAISSTSSSVSVGQTAHEVELHLLPAVGVARGDGADEVVLGHRLVDHPADPLAAALGGEGQAGAAAVAGTARWRG